ncbi:MAG: hypothetical protein O2854_07005 [Chloroflexi bacterium]|nr:hypothetical protein [Chloroflexota bacterium]
MADTLLPLKIPPGMRQTGTVYQSKGRWFTGNFVRFFQDTIQPIGGWVARSITSTAPTGVPRAMVTYKITGGATHVTVIGTTRGIWAIKAGVWYDVTPSTVTTNVAARVWQFDVFGEYLIAVDFQAPTSGGTLYYWTGDTAVVAAPIPNGPIVGAIQVSQSARSVVATPERFLVMLGGFEPALTP